jgi:hypothetical protein
MKDHAIFIENALPAPEIRLAQEADRFKQQFEQLLASTIILANASVSKESLLSGEFYTRFTDEAERLTMQFTDIDINRNLILQTTNIEPLTQYSVATAAKEQDVSLLNQSILTLMDQFISFKTGLYNNQVSCWLITSLYTAVLEHVLEEAREYVTILTSLQRRETPQMTISPEKEYFWAHLMLDHAKAIRGLLDPSEMALFNEADDFSKLFTAITDSYLVPGDNIVVPAGDATLTETIALSELKAHITRGLIECKVKALMIPLYADHLLREAYHFIRLLQY